MYSVSRLCLDVGIRFTSVTRGQFHCMNQCVNEFAPIDHFEHRSFINNLSMDVYVHRMVYGGSIGTLTYIWKINPPLSDHEE